MTTTRMAVCVELGPPEKLEIQERGRFEPGPGEVSIEVRASGLNFVDTLFIQGLYQIKPQPPFTPGGEVAGVVDAVGEGVTQFQLGDPVVAMPGLNGFAEQVIVAEKQLMPLPEGLDFARGAVFIQSYATALFALKMRGQLRAGETVLVLGAAGGVGSAAVDVARSMGARVIAAASGREKLDACRARGAEAVIDYVEEDLKLRAKELSNGGVDVVVDPVGDRFADPALRAIAPGGRYLVIGFAAGEIPRLPFNLILLKQCQVVGVDWGGWSAKHREENRALLDELGDWIKSGRLAPPLPQAYPFDQCRVALRDLMERRVVGKAVLLMQ